MYFLDRRTIERFAIPNSWVIYQKNKYYYCFGKLLNISRSAVCFEIDDKPLSVDSEIELTLIFPNEEQLNIKGIVIRETESMYLGFKYAVVQFMPYGLDEKRYNSMDTYQRIKELEIRFINKITMLKLELVENK